MLLPHKPKNFRGKRLEPSGRYFYPQHKSRKILKKLSDKQGRILNVPPNFHQSFTLPAPLLLWRKRECCIPSYLKCKNPRSCSRFFCLFKNNYNKCAPITARMTRRGTASDAMASVEYAPDPKSCSKKANSIHISRYHAL